MLYVGLAASCSPAARRDFARRPQREL